MKRSNINSNVITWLLLALLIVGCTKNETKYYADNEDVGLGIFSNTGNNLMSCFVNGRPWRTNDRVLSGLNPLYRYEVNVYRIKSNALRDTLVIDWDGYFQEGLQNLDHISLFLAIPHNVGYQYLSSLQGQRLQIGPSNGYFSTGTNGLNPGNTKGTGNIYFNTARFDSISAYTHKGVISGLLDADFISFKITKGRFDHILTEPQIIF